MTEVTITGNDITVAIDTTASGGVTEAQLATKVDKITGKGLSTEDYTTAEKSKLSGVEPGATADQTGAEIKTAYENEADTNAFNDADKAKVDNLPADISKYISIPLGAFDPTAIVFDQKGTYSNHVLSGNTTFAKTGALREGIEQYVRITTDSAYVLNFTSDFEVGAKYGITDGGTLATGAWWFYMTVINGKIHVSVPGVSPIDVTPPTLSNFTVATATPFRVGFSSSEAITGTTFAGFTIPGHTITGVTINAGQTTGHYLTVAERFVQGEVARTVTYDGADDWKDVDNNELAAFGPVAITNSVTAPVISSVVVAGDNSTVTVNLSVGGYANDNGTGDLLVADFTPSISGGVATSPVLSNPVHTAGGTAVVFDLAYTGGADGNEVLTITVASGASVYDQYGNAMQAGESGADTLNSDAAPYTFANTHELVVDLAGEGVFITNNNLYPSDGAGTDQVFTEEFLFETYSVMGAVRVLGRLNFNASTSYVLVGITSLNRLFFQLKTDASNYLNRQGSATLGIALSANTLYHLAVTYDASKTIAGLKIYVNAVEESNYADVSAGSYTGLPAKTDDAVMDIGNATSGAAGLGNYQVYRRFNQVLTPTEITYLNTTGRTDGLSVALQAKCVQELLLNNNANADNIGVNGTVQGTATFQAV